MRQPLWTAVPCVVLALSTSACATIGAQEPQRPATTGSVTEPRTVTGTAALNVVPVGQELDVRLQKRLSSDTAKVEDRFEATTVVDLRQDSDVLMPAGSVVRGVVAAVDRATRLDRTRSLMLSFDRITVRGRTYPIRALAVDAFRSEGLEGEASRIGAGASVGAISGGLLGGVKGALAGVLIGAGGVLAATEGKDVVLPAGTMVRIQFSSPLQLKPST